MRMSTEQQISLEEQEEAKGTFKNVNLLEIFPDAFLFCCLFLFIMPWMKAYFLVTDSSTQYFMGSFPLVVLMVPIIFIVVAHFIHSSKGLPSKGAVILAIIGSALVLGCLGYSVALKSMRLSGGFKSSDCNSFYEKYKLQQQWVAAQEFRKGCKQAAASPSFPLWDCPGYEEAKKQNPGWTFLASVEAEYGCGGWCSPSSSIWSYSAGVKDSCDSLVAQSLEDKVVPLAVEVVMYQLLVLAICCVSLVMMGSSIKAAGIPW